MEKIKLGDVIDIRRGMTLPGEFYSETGEFIRLTAGNFDYINNCFKDNTSKSDIYYVGKIREDCLLKKGDMITPMTEQVKGLIGSTAFIPVDDLYVLSNDIGLITCSHCSILYDLFIYEGIDSLFSFVTLQSGLFIFTILDLFTQI